MKIEIEKHEEAEEHPAVHILARITYMLIRIVVPLTIGRFFGIVAERFAFVFVIYTLSTDFLDMAEEFGLLVAKVELLAEKEKRSQGKES